MKLVFADFDQTITRFDTLLPFAHFLLRGKGELRRYPQVLFHFALFRAGLLSDRSFRSRLCRVLTAGCTVEEVRATAEHFHQAYASQLINPAVWSRLQEETGPAGSLVILSTNFDFVIAPLGRRHPGLAIHSTQAAIAAGRYTGALAQHVGSGADKLRIFETLVAQSPGCETIGFGDSPVDRAFLGRCQRAWLVRHPHRGWAQSWRAALRGTPDASTPNSDANTGELVPFGR